MKKLTAKKIIMLVIEILLATVLVLNVTTAVISKLDAREQLGWMPYAVMNVQGGSMNPQLSKGDLIIVKKEPYESLEVGDDITFLTEEGFVTHRITGESDGEYITRGLTNNIDDVCTVGADEYCGKVVADIPIAGHIVSLIAESYLVMAGCILLIIAICFGGPIFRAVRTRKDEKTARSAFSVPRRALACVCALSMLFCMPYFTDAKYIGQINYVDMAVARPLYFTSNYLEEGAGNNYSIQGWNGNNYEFNLKIGNYANELLYNNIGTDVKYAIGTKIYGEDDGYVTGYDLKITPATGVTALEENSFVYPDEWTQNGIIPYNSYMLTGGEYAEHGFSVLVDPIGDEPITNGKDADGNPIKKKIKFEIYATTEEGKTYSIKLLGVFEMFVADSLEFLGQVSVQDKGAMVAVDVKTNLISEGSGEKVLVYSWDPEEVYLNEFESTAFNVITKYPSYYDEENGYLWLKAQAYANIHIEFFKKVDFVADLTTVVVQEVDQVGDYPTERGNTLPDEPADGGGEDGGGSGDGT